MCYAQVMLLTMPVMCRLCRANGWLSVFLMFIALQYLPDGIVSSSGGSYNMYLCGQVLGIVCAQKDAFRVFRQAKGFAKKAAVFVLLWAGVVLLVELRFWLVSESFTYNYRHLNWVLYAIAAVLVCATTVVEEWKPLDAALMFLGKHSGNMFFIHMFFVYYASDAVFFTGTVVGSWLTLVAVSLAASVAVELLKKWIRY